MSENHSGWRARFRQEFGMIRLESGGSDCPMGMSFWGKGVNTSHTPKQPNHDQVKNSPDYKQYVRLRSIL